VEGALRGFAGPIDAERLEPAPLPRAATGDAQIVVVQAQVVENVGHVLGNLFQRLYHLIDLAGVADAEAGTELERSTRQLEDFLQLVMDYFSPLALALQYVPSAEVVQSLGRQMSDTVGCSVKIDARLSSESRVLVDPARLARGFALLAARLRPDAGHHEGLDLRLLGQAAGPSLTVTAILPQHLLLPRSTEAEIQWAVAEKLLETHGGSVHEKSTVSGEVLWEIALPLQP